MASLPQHVSLKQPFLIPSLEETEGFFDELARKFKMVNIKSKNMKKELCTNYLVLHPPKIKSDTILLIE